MNRKHTPDTATVQQQGHITGQVSALDTLSNSELRYRRLFETAQDGILILDAVTGMIVDVNPFLINLMGFSREAFLGKEVWELGFFKDIVANRDNFEELLRKEYIRYDDKPLETADGRRVDVEFVSNVYQVNHHKVIQCNIRDISERRRVNKVFQETRNLLDEMGRIARIGGWKMDLITRKATWTQGTYDIVEIAPSEPIPGPDEHVDYYLPEYRAMVVEAMRALIEDGKPLDFEAQLRTAKGNIKYCHAMGQGVRVAGKTVEVYGTLQDITERKEAEEKLQESEGRARAKLNALLLPEGDIGALDLADIIDVQAIQALMNDFFGLTNVGVAIMDLKGKLLVATGWQGICTKFHRVHPETCKHCIESDTVLSERVAPGTFKLYQCKNNMWDIVTPITMGGRHVGNLFLGQFLFADEQPDYELFRTQARQYGFDENEYLAALDRVPRWSREKVNEVMTFYARLAQLISELSYSNVKLARTLTERNRLVDSLRSSEQRFRTLVETIPDLIWLKDPNGVYLSCNRRFSLFFGAEEAKIVGKTDYDFIDRELADSFRAHDCKAMEAGGPSVNEEWVTFAADGHRELLETIKTPLHDARGQLLGVLGIARDITERNKVERERRDSEEKFVAAFHASPNLMTITRMADGMILEVNERYSELLGYSRDESIGKTAVGLSLWANPADRATFADMVQRFGKIVDFETTLRSKDGTVLTVLDSARTIELQGETCILSSVHDITERKRAAEELQFRNVLLSIQQEVSLDGILVVDEKNRIVSYNRRFVDMWRLPAVLVKDRVDEPVLRFVAAQVADTPSFLRRVQYLYEHRQETSRDELILGDGRVFDRYSASMFGPNERYYGRVWYFRDITERKQAEKANLRLATAVEQAAETIAIADVNATLLYVNPAFEKTTGYTSEEVLGQNPRILKSGKHDAAFYRRMWAVLAAGEVWRGRFINKRKDGTLYEEDASISPVHDALGKIVNFVAVKRDITREVQLEHQLRQAQKMEAIGHLAGGVAHDFNNLLMGIMGYTELCRGSIEPNHPIQAWLDEITRSAERSAEITRQLLAFARKQTIAPKIVDLNAAVAGMLNLLRRLLGEDITLTWRPGAELRLVKIDPSQMDQILANLCVNARDAIAGVGEIILETGNTTIRAEDYVRHPEAIPGVYVFLTVSDNGCGMDPATLAQIFEPFFTTKDLGKGTGLGLATVYGIVKQNKGFVYAYSEPGKGTTFKIYLPQVEASTVESPEADTDSQKVPKGRGETVLLVEDEKALRVTCGIFLENLGYKVLVAETPAEALRMTDQYPGTIHLLLTDVVMPDMNGRNLAERIVSTRTELKVLFMSGYTADVIAQRGVLDECVHFLAKPFTRNDLARKVRQVLGGVNKRV